MAAPAPDAAPGDNTGLFTRKIDAQRGCNPGNGKVPVPSPGDYEPQSLFAASPQNSKILASCSFTVPKDPNAPTERSDLAAVGLYQPNYQAAVSRPSGQQGFSFGRGKRDAREPHKDSLSRPTTGTATRMMEGKPRPKQPPGAAKAPSQMGSALNEDFFPHIRNHRGEGPFTEGGPKWSIQKRAAFNIAQGFC
mmetsp:Transcript_38389/g.108892  ORF Transcript_38389/g.108892 Transcript_38389/m.108892 type:complete len:193 (-) Transcript_38389:136-714(-)